MRRTACAIAAAMLFALTAPAISHTATPVTPAPSLATYKTAALRTQAERPQLDRVGYKCMTACCRHGPNRYCN
jgi:uncharacterized protein YuzB (UPF0349 family)